MLDSAGIADYRNFTQRRIAYARYRVGSTWYKTYLSDVSIRSDGIVRAQLNINSGGSSITVNRVELYNSDSALFAHQDCSITINAGQTGILYWFDINIKEVAG
jgi:hypothetical protein